MTAYLIVTNLFIIFLGTFFIEAGIRERESGEAMFGLGCLVFAIWPTVLLARL